MHQKYVALLLCTVAWFTHCFVRGALPVLLPLITKEFSLSYTDAGILVTSSLFVFALIQLPSGYLAGRIGSKPTLIFGIASLTISSFLLAISTSYVQFFLATILGNIGPGCHLTVATAYISNHFEEKEIGKAIGTHESAVSIGALLSSLAILPLALMFSWRQAYLICAGQSLVVAVVIWLILPRGERLQTERVVVLEEEKGILSKRLVLIFSMFTFHAFAYQAIQSFLPLFIAVEKQIPLIYLAYYAAVPHTMGVFGRPLGGYLSDRVGRKNVILSSTSLLAIGIVLSVFVHADYSLLLALVLLGFGLHTLIPVMFALLVVLFPRSKRAIWIGRLNTVRHSIAALSPAIVGSIIDSSGFSTAFLVLAGVVLAGFIVTLRFPEKQDPHGK